MAEDLPGPPGGGSREDRPGDRPTEPLGGTPPTPSPTPPTPPPGQPGYGPPGDQPQGYGQYQGYGQPQGYGYGYGYQAPPPTDSSAIAALVIAIVGFFTCPPVGAVVALVLANSAEKRIEASGGRLGGRDQARAARIIAIVELVLSAVLILLGVLLLAASLGPR